jgi:hypothetical protein
VLAKSVYDDEGMGNIRTMLIGAGTRSNLNVDHRGSCLSEEKRENEVMMMQLSNLSVYVS